MKKYISIIAVLALIFSPVTPAFAWAGGTNGTWTADATGNWSDEDNWDGGIIANDSGATADFSTIGISGNITVHLDSSRTIGNLMFGDTLNSGYDWVLDNSDVAGNIVTLAGGSSAITVVDDFGSGTSATISAVISGTEGLTKNGAGTLVLSGTNTYTGTTYINEGFLVIESSNALGDVSGGVEVANGAELHLRGDVSVGEKALTIDGYYNDAALWSVSGNNSWAGAITLVDSGDGAWVGADTGSTLTLTGEISGESDLGVWSAGTTIISGNITMAGYGIDKDDDGALTLSGDNTYTGDTYLDAGTLNINSNTALGGFEIEGEFEVGTFYISSGTTIDNTSGSAITLINDNAQAWESDFTFTGTNDLNLGTGNVLISDSMVVTVEGGNLTAGGGVSDDFGEGSVGYGLTKAGAGTLKLTGTNTYTGTTTVAGGTLIIGNGTTGSLAATALTFESTGKIEFKEAAASSQNMGLLTFNAGDGTVQNTFVATSATLTFSDVSVRTSGATANFIVSGGANGDTNEITFDLLGGFLPSTKALLDKGMFFGGNNYAAYDAEGYLRAYTTTDDDAVVSPGGETLGLVDSSTNAFVTGAITAQTSASVNTLNITGAYDITLSDGQTLDVEGILKSGGNAASIGGGSGAELETGAELVIRTDSASDTLTINTTITGGALTKSGDGTLTLNGANGYTGRTTVNAGTLNLNQSLMVMGEGSALFFAGGTVNLANEMDIYTSITAVDGTGTLTFLGTSEAGQIGDSGSALSVVNIAGDSESTVTVDGSIYAYDVNVGAGTLELYGDFYDPNSADELKTLTFTDDGIVSLGNGYTIEHNITTTNDGEGTIIFQGQGEVTGQIGEAEKYLKAIHVTNNGSSVNLGTDEDFALPSYVNRLSFVNGDPEGEVDSPTVDFYGDAYIGQDSASAAITTESDGYGYIYFEGDATIMGDIGASEKAIEAIDLYGIGATLYLGGNVYSSVNEFLEPTTYIYFDNDYQTIEVAAGKNIDASVEASGLNSTVTFLGSTTVNTALGENGSEYIGTVNFNGGTATLNNSVYADDFFVNNAATLSVASTDFADNEGEIDGDLTLKDTSTLELGTNTLSVSGIYTQDAAGQILSITITDEETFGNLIAGYAAFSAGTVNVTVGGATIANGTTFVIFDAGDGAVTVGGITVTVLDSEEISFTLSTTDDTTDLILTAVVGGAEAYWTGNLGSAWNATAGGGTVTNWATDQSGGTDTEAVPDATTDVYFYADDAVNLNTTLGESIAIKSLTMVGASAVTLGDGVEAFTLTVGSGGITINDGAGALTIHSDMVLGAAQTWSNGSANLFSVTGDVNNGGYALTINGAGDTTLSGVVSGTGALTKNGAGALNLNGANTYSGNTTINAGTLYLTADQASPLYNFTGDSELKLADGVDLAADITTGTDNTGSLTFEGNGTVEGQIGDDTNALKAVTLNGAAGTTVTLTGDVYATDMYVGAGTLELNGSFYEPVIPNATLIFTADGFVTLADGKTIFHDIKTQAGNNTGTLTFEGDGVVSQHIGEDGAALKTINADGEDTLVDLQGDVYANAVNFGADGEVQVGGTANLGTVSNTSGTNDSGTLTLLSDATITGQVGALTAYLRSINITNNGDTVLFKSDVYTNFLNFGDEAGSDTTATFDGKAYLYQNITNGSNGKGVLNFNSGATLNGTVGAAGAGLAEVYFNGGTAVVNNAIYAQDVYVTGSAIMGFSSSFEDNGGKIDGNLTSQNTSSLDVGSNSLEVTGDYTQGAGTTLQLNVISATTSGNVVVGGTTVVEAGGKVSMTVPTGISISNGTQFTIITTSGAAGDTLNAPTVTSNTRRYAFAASKDGAGNLILTSSEGSYTAPSGATGNESNVANTLNSITNPTGDMNNVLDELGTLSDEAYDQALDTMHPDMSSGSAEGSRALTAQGLSMVSNRLGGARSGGAVGAGVSAGEMLNGVGVWMQGLGSHIKQGERKGVEGYLANLFGTTVGADKVLDSHFRAGFAGSYGWARVKSKTAGSPSDDINSYQATIYGSFDSLDLCKSRQGGKKSYEAVRSQVENSWYVDGMFAFTQNNYDSRREIWLGASKRVAKADHYGQQYSTNFEAGYKFVFEKTKSLEVTPFAGLGYNYLYMNKYKEKGAQALNLTVDGEGFQQLEQSLGTKLAYPLVNKKMGTFIPSVKAAWLYDYIGDRFESTASFAGGGTSFTTQGAKPARNGMLFGAELAFLNKGNVTLTGNWDCEVKDQFLSNTYYGTARYDF